MIKFFRRKRIKFLVKRKGYYMGKKGCIRKCGYADDPAWCVTNYYYYSCPKSILKSCVSLDEAVESLMELERIGEKCESKS